MKVTASQNLKERGKVVSPRLGKFNIKTPPGRDSSNLDNLMKSPRLQLPDHGVQILSEESQQVFSVSANEVKFKIENDINDGQREVSYIHTKNQQKNIPKFAMKKNKSDKRLENLSSSPNKSHESTNQGFLSPNATKNNK